MEERKKCHYKDCYQEVEYLCGCSYMIYSCKNHISDHLDIYDESDEVHNFKKIFTINKVTKKELIELFRQEKSKIDQLKINSINLFSEHIRASETNFKRYLNKLASDLEKISEWIDLIFSTQKVLKTEQDPILMLLLLHPKEAVEKAKSLISYHPDSFNFPEIFRLPNLENELNELKNIDSFEYEFRNLISAFERIEKSIKEKYKIIDLTTKDLLTKAKISISDLITGKRENINSVLELKIADAIAWECENSRIINPHKEIDINCHFYYNDRTTVRKGKLKSNRTEVAIKIYKSTEIKKVKKYEKEAQVLEILNGRCSFFLDYYGKYWEDELKWGRTVYKLYLVTELCKRDLLDDINSNASMSRCYNICEYESIISDLLEGFAMLENLNIYHCDICPRNIFIAKSGKPKIAGFNTSELLDSPEKSARMHHIRGRADYMSPELKKHYKLMRIDPSTPEELEYKLGKADVYSLGLTFLQLLTMTSIDRFNKIDRQEEWDNYLDQINIKWLSEMLKGMLKIDPEERFTFKKAISYLPGPEPDDVNATLPSY